MTYESRDQIAGMYRQAWAHSDAQIAGMYRQAWAHSDATIQLLALDASGQAWWGAIAVKLERVAQEASSRGA